MAGCNVGDMADRGGIPWHWVLDRRGGAVIGPAELGTRRRGECNGAGAGNRTGVTSGWLKFNKGIKGPHDSLMQIQCKLLLGCATLWKFQLNIK